MPTTRRRPPPGSPALPEALFQILEPGESRQKAACTPGTTRAIGIDLGTTNSLVASVKDGKPVALLGDDGDAIVPSVVHYAAGPSGGVVVGKEARDRLATQSPR